MKQNLRVAFATLAFCTIAPSGFCQTYSIFANDDVFVDTVSGVTSTYNAYSQSQQINWGLAGANGVSTGRRRSYIEFTLGPEQAESVRLMLYNYWGGPDVNGQGRVPSGQLRIRGTLEGTPVEFTEPPEGTIVTDFVPPDEANFETITTTDPGAITTIGWFELNITDWYNARLGQTTTLLVRGAATSGFDFPLFEDSEGTAYNAGAGGTIFQGFPHLLVTVPEPATLLLLPIGAMLLALWRRR